MGEVTLDNIAQLLNKQTIEITKTIERSSDALERKVGHLKKRCVTLERRLRKNNIVLFGLNIDKENIVAGTIEQLNNLFELNITVADINNIYKIGGSEKPPVVVEFISFLKKQEIFKNPEKLKSLRSKNVSVSNDLCYEDRLEQETLRRHCKLAREKELQAKIRGHRLEIEGKFYTASELEQLDYETVSSESEEEQDDEEEEQAATQPDTVTDNKQRGAVKFHPKDKKKRKVQTPSPLTKQAGITTRTKKKARVN